MVLEGGALRVAALKYTAVFQHPGDERVPLQPNNDPVCSQDVLGEECRRFRQRH